MKNEIVIPKKRMLELMKEVVVEDNKKDVSMVRKLRRWIKYLKFYAFGEALTIHLKFVYNSKEEVFDEVS